MSEISAQYDAVMLVSYGGPRQMEDVLPFMRNATSGRGVPDERIQQVSTHYGRFHGISPINARNLEIRRALELELSRRGDDIEVVIGNRNWHPFIHETLCDLAMRGLKRVLCIFTSAYVCYSGCRQYREDLARAKAQLQAQELSLKLDKVRAYYTTEGFVGAYTKRLVESVRSLEKDSGHLPYVAFVTHSIPTAMQECSGPADNCRPDYVCQHQEVCSEVAARASKELGRELNWDLSYCSRSGPPQMPWLEPDINDRLAQLKAEGVTDVVCVPIGFICDHMEVVYDLDTEAKETAVQLGLNYLRVPTVGTEPGFIGALADLVKERAGEKAGGEVAYAPDALEPRWPAWASPGDSRGSKNALDLPVEFEIRKD